MKQNLALLVAATLAVAGCRDNTAPVQQPDQDVNLAVGSGSDIIPGRFIVTLRDGSDPRGVAAEYAVEADYVYTHALTGFAGAISDAARAGLLRDARVTRVEPDGIARAVTTQSNATWGIDRIDQRALPLSTTYSYTNTGSGVTAYIIDTGILTSHTEFGGRAVGGYDAFGGTAEDCNGHGTHVAGTVGGTTYGVAKGVTLVAVRVLDCGGSGTWSGVVAGIDWVVGDHDPTEPAVSNMSLGGGANQSVDDATNRMINDGVASAVAAGNDGANACRYSPARVPNAMTIGATTKSDARPYWSNVGDCIDWFAPGSGITSAWHTSTTATNTISGTSMASPHTAGVAALHLQSYPGATAIEVRDALYALTTKGIVTKSRTKNNHLLYTNY